MTDRMRTLAALLGMAVLPLWPVHPTAQEALSQRIVHTDPARFRQLVAVHGGAGKMAFTALLDRGAVTPEFNFLHRGVIPPGAGIRHHVHNVVEEMFLILDGEAQSTIDGRTAAASPTADVSRRVLGPSVFSTTWAYVDHVLVPPGVTTSELAHSAVGEAYYVLAA